MAEQPLSVTFDGTPTTKTVNNALVAIVGIDDYHTNPHWKNLNGVIGDVEKSIKLWSEYFCYDTTVLANKSNNDENDEQKANRSKIYRDDVFDFMLDNVRDPLTRKDNKYDALIFMIFGHGMDESLITSDCTPIYYDEIRSYFDATQVRKKWAAHHMRLFIIDTCRGTDHSHTLTIPSRGNSFNPKTVNKDSNICTYYATTKNYAVGDKNEFIDTIDKTMRMMDINEYTLYEIITKIASGLDNKSRSWYCPEFVSTNKFKIKLKKRTNVEKGNVSYWELEGEEKTDDDITIWSKQDANEGVSTIKQKKKSWWEWMKEKLFEYGPWVVAVILFYFLGRYQVKFVFPIKFGE